MSTDILIINHAPTEKLSKAQKAFNSNIKKIKSFTERVERGKEFLKATQIKIAQKMAEPKQEIIGALLDKFRLFEAYYDDSFFNKKEKEKIADLIYNETNHIGHPEIEAIHDKFKTLSDNDNNTTHADAYKQMVENMTGFSFDDNDDIDFDDPESVEEAIREKFEAQEANRKKTKRDLKMDEEEVNIGKVLKTIYKELVMAFHPDKELDETQKLKKTEITKQVTIAFKNKDVFKLLSLKIELLSSSLDLKSTADTDLKYYNKLLSQQVFGLESQLYALGQQGNSLLPRLQYDFMFVMENAPELIEKEIKKESNLIKQQTKQIAKETQLFKDKKEVRRFLKTYDMDGMFLF